MAVVDLLKAIKSTTTANAIALSELNPGDSFVMRGDGTVSGSFAFTDITNTYETLLGSGNPTTNLRFNLPSDAGGANYVMITDGGGNLSLTSDLIINSIQVAGPTLFAADTTHSADILPDTTLTYNVGSAALEWANIYAGNVDATTATFGDITIGVSEDSSGPAANTIATLSDNLYIHAITNETIIDTNLTVTGDFTVNGTSITANSTTVTIDDPIFTLGGDTELTVNDALDRGIEYRWHDGTTAKLGFFGWDNSTQSFTFIPDATNTAETFIGTAGPVIFGGVTATTGTFSSIFNVDGATTLAGTTIDNVSITNATITNGPVTANDNVILNANLTIGNADTDLVAFNSKVNSNIVPNGDLVYELGTIDNRWMVIYAEALRTTSTIIGDINLGGSASNEIDTTAGDLILDSTGGNVIVDDNLQITGLTPTRVVYVGASKQLVDSSNMTFDGTTLSATALQVDNVNIDGNTITSSAANLTLSQDVVISGNLTVSGTTSTVNSTTVNVVDPIITLGSNTADNLDRGIEFLHNDGTTKTGFFGFDSSTSRFTFIPNATNTSEVFSGSIGDFQMNTLYTVNSTVSGNETIAGTLGVTGDTTLNANATVVGNTNCNSNLTVSGVTTSTGNFVQGVAGVASSMTVNGIANFIGGTNIGDGFTASTVSIFSGVDTHVFPDANNARNLGGSTLRWNTVYATTFDGTATATYYADLAENYFADKDYDEGTVMIFGGNMEITESTKMNDTRVAGVISTNPAHLMNTKMHGDTVFPLALQGRVPCKVIGKVEKGDIIVTSSVPGYGMVNNTATAGTIIGKAVGDKKTHDKGTVEVVVGRT